MSVPGVSVAGVTGGLAELGVSFPQALMSRTAATAADAPVNNGTLLRMIFLPTVGQMGSYVRMTCWERQPSTHSTSIIVTTLRPL